MSPIPGTLIRQDGDRCILMYDDETVLDAVIALRNARGEESWHLVVDLEGGGYAAAGFEAVATWVRSQGVENKVFFESLLGALVNSALPRVEVVAEHDRDDLADVQQRILQSAGGVGIVVRAGEFVGILVPTQNDSMLAEDKEGLSLQSAKRSVTRGLFGSGLLGMASQIYAEIPEKGTLSRRRREARNKKQNVSSEANDEVEK
jgi:hypothetical protein